MPDPETTAVKLAFSNASYNSGIVRLVDRNLAGFTHIIASRQGLYVANEGDWKLIALGFFFGITLRGDDLFVFEACDLPRGPTRRGRLIRLSVTNGVIVRAEVLVRGLDNGCHQIDFIDGRLIVLDTYNQQLLRFVDNLCEYETLSPLPVSPTGRWQEADPAYRHVNSLLAVGDRRLLLLHNQSFYTGRQSELAVCDRDWKVQRTVTLQGTGCHGLVLRENGSILTAGSMEGSVVGTDGFTMIASPYMTRGLAVGAETVVVGASRMSRREDRLHSSGTLTFMDKDFEVGGVLMMPGAPTEVRRLDGQDAGLSTYLAGVPWELSLKIGKEA